MNDNDVESLDYSDLIVSLYLKVPTFDSYGRFIDHEY